MDDFFFSSDPWGDFYGLAPSPSPANIRRRPPTPPVASTSRPQRRPVASPTPAPRPQRHPVATPTPNPKPGTFSVPIHYMGADGLGSRRAAARVLTPSDAAKRIQKVFRGFAVRKMVKKVSSIAAEIDAIEVMMASLEEVEKISSDPREKLRLGELLMCLLLRLDSVIGVRDYRRKVIRRAIRMQEVVDSILSSEQMVDAQPAGENIEERSEGQQSSGNNLIRDAKEKEAAEEEIETTVHTKQVEGHCHAIAREEDVGEKQPEVDLQAAGGKVEASKVVEAHEEEAVDDGFLVLSMDEKLNSSSKEPEFEIVMERSTMESDYLVPAPTAMDIDAEIRVDPTERETEVVKKILAENEKLLQLVNALREQSAQQRMLIEGLTCRMGKLEQALQEMERRKDKETC